VLKTIRDRSRSVGVKVIYGLLALTFVAWGAGNYGDSRLEVVATIYGDRVTRADLDREAALLTRQFEQISQGAPPPAGLDFRAQALERLVQDALIRHEAERLGLGVTEEELLGTITAMPELQRNGQFDRELLERILDIQRDRGEFEFEVQRDILMQRLRNLVLDAVRVTPGEVEEEFRFQYARANLGYVRITAADLADEVTVSEETLAAYLADHEDRYLGPPRVRVRYLAFRPADYADLAAPSASQIEAYYQAHLGGDFTKPEQVKARHILVRVEADAGDEDRAAAKAEADALLARIRAGEDFATLAKEHSDDSGTSARGGELGWAGRGRMFPEFDEAAFTLEPGSVSEVVQSTFGYHLIQVEEYAAGGPQDLAAARDAIVATLSKERGLEIARREADQVRRAIVGGQTLAQAAGDRKLEETVAFPRGTFVPELGQAEAFNTAAFALGVGQVSDLIEENDVVYILEPTEQTGPQVPPLDEIRQRVETDARADLAQAKALEKGEALLARAREVGFDEAREEAGYEAKETGFFTRRTRAMPELGVVPGLHDETFRLGMEQPLASEVYTAGRDAIVAVLRGRQEADQTAFAQESAALDEALLQRKRGQVFDEYVNLLKDRANQVGELEVKTDVLAS
jgi:peptidyl-prolyl cis-trans isomerase D